MLTPRPVQDDYKLVLVFSTLQTSDLLQLHLPETLQQIHVLWYNITLLNWSSVRPSRPWRANPGMLVRHQPLVLAFTSRPHPPAQLRRLNLHVVMVYFGGLFVRRHFNQPLLSPSWLWRFWLSTLFLKGCLFLRRHYNQLLLSPSWLWSLWLSTLCL